MEEHDEGGTQPDYDRTQPQGVDASQAGCDEAGYRPIPTNWRIIETRGSGVYAIVQLATGTAYIGATGDLRRRQVHHSVMLANGNHQCVPLRHAYAKAAGSGFKFVVLEETPDPFVAERDWMRCFSRLFNARLNG